jgi:hypothetical protein
MVAPLLRPGQVKVIAQSVEQGRPRRNLYLFHCAIDLEGDSSFRGQRNRCLHGDIGLWIAVHIHSLFAIITLQCCMR